MCVCVCGVQKKAMQYFARQILPNFNHVFALTVLNTAFWNDGIQGDFITQFVTAESND